MQRRVSGSSLMQRGGSGGGEKVREKLGVEVYCAVTARKLREREQKLQRKRISIVGACGVRMPWKMWFRPESEDKDMGKDLKILVKYRRLRDVLCI